MHMGDDEPGDSPMGAQDIAAASAYYEQAETLHAQAKVDESVAGVMDVFGLGAELHKQAAEHEREADVAETSGWRMYTAAQERDWAHEAQEELREIDRREDLAEVKERVASDGLAKDDMTEHERTALEVDRDSARAELATLQRREDELEKVEVGYENMARESERFAREGEPPESAAPDAGASATPQ
jgi:hypothetical protein